MSSELLIPKIGPIAQPSDASLRGPAEKGNSGFDQILKGNLRAVGGEVGQAREPLKFSAHAMNRIKERSISMNSELMGKLEKAVDTAALKGAKESLILSEDAAFIVSVKNKTVITVVDRNQMSGNVFTNIDSTVVI